MISFFLLSNSVSVVFSISRITPSDRDGVDTGDIGSKVRPKGEIEEADWPLAEWPTEEVADWPTEEVVEWPPDEDGERWEARREEAEKEEEGDEDKQSDASGEHSVTCVL